MIKTNLFLLRCSARDFSIRFIKKKEKARLKLTTRGCQFDKEKYLIGRKLPT